IPIGTGVEGRQLLVVTRGGPLAGVAELGEICVRSPLLADGYVGADDLTRERFAANPATGDAADRTYRTGDLGRYLPDGAVSFHGRSDRQLKVRGHRI